MICTASRSSESLEIIASAALFIFARRDGERPYPDAGGAVRHAISEHGNASYRRSSKKRPSRNKRRKNKLLRQARDRTGFLGV